MEPTTDELLTCIAALVAAFDDEGITGDDVNDDSDPRFAEDSKEAVRAARVMLKRAGK